MQNERLRKTSLVLGLLLLGSSCSHGRLLFERAGWSTPHDPATVGSEPAGTADVSSPSRAALSTEDTPLLGWDGGVVDGPPPGVREGDPRDGGIQPSTTGRMHIIELYQQVLDERDSLRDEVEALTAALERSQATVAEIAEQQHGFELRINELEVQNEAMMNENSDLAARLATAQIRRLESEKLLLETRIDQLRAAEHAAAGLPSERGILPPDTPQTEERP